MKKHNFSAGPSILPEYTFQQCSKAVLDLDGIGLSILEISHRGDEFMKILEDTKVLFRKLLNIPSHYEVLFIQGGASMQFCMVPYNLLGENQTAHYLETGVWSEKAIEEAKLFGNVNIVASSKENSFKHIPKGFSIPKEGAYFHITTNNTIYGTEIFEEYNSPIPLVADMSSDILSRTIDVSKYGLIYAGAQKNIGPSGLTVVILNPEILPKGIRKIPSMLDYTKYIKNDSMYNTPPTFAIYATLQTLKWLDNLGGVKEIEKINRKKAQLLYDEIDRNPLFVGWAEKPDRSLMNVTFNLVDKTTEKDFLDLCDKKGISGIKGHRSVGGFRASIYNALPIESVEVLVKAMKEFEKIKNS